MNVQVTIKYSISIWFIFVLCQWHKKKKKKINLSLIFINLLWNILVNEEVTCSQITMIHPGLEAAEQPEILTLPPTMFDFSIWVFFYAICLLNVFQKVLGINKMNSDNFFLTHLRCVFVFSFSVVIEVLFGSFLIEKVFP